MSRIKKALRVAADMTSLVAAGVSVGWLTGMSVSPVVQGVVTALVGVITAVLAALAGLKASGREGQQPDRLQKIVPSPIPIALAMTGIALGAALGVFTRTHAWLAPSTADTIEEWQAYDIQNSPVARRLFAQAHPAACAPGVVKAEPPTPSPNGGGVLFSDVTPSVCEEWNLKKLTDLGALKKTLISSTILDATTRRFVNGLDEKQTGVFVALACP